MKYKAPFYAVSKATYGALQASNIGLQWFDSSVPFEEIESQFRGLEEMSYGVFGDSRADCQPNKDLAVWDCSLSLDIYSNYKGRKIISQNLEALLNYFSDDEGWNNLQAIFLQEGYKMISLQVGELRINRPIYLDIGVWQNGNTSISFKIEQVEEV